jgi:hypothetical protein
MIAHKTIFLTLELMISPATGLVEERPQRTIAVSTYYCRAYYLRRDLSLERFIPVRFHFRNPQKRTHVPLGRKIRSHPELAGPNDRLPAHNHRPVTPLP